MEVPKEVVDLFALIQQIDGLDKGRVEQLKRTLITAVQNGVKIPAIPEIEEKVKADISIEEMYGITDGKVEYGKANSIVKNMFYLSKARKNAIQLSNVLSEILGQNSGFEDIIQYIRENGFRVEPEIITRQSNKGVKLSESVSLDLQQEEQILVNEIKKLSFEENDGILNNYFEVACVSHPPLCSSAIVIKKKIIQKIGGFPLNVTSGEDLITWARLSTVGMIAYNKNAYVYYYINTKPQQSNEPKDFQSTKDYVGTSLKQLYLTEKDIECKKNIARYISFWYKMRASINIMLNHKIPAMKCALKSIKYNPYDIKPYIFLLLATIPTKAASHMYTFLSQFGRNGKSTVCKS